MSEFIKVKLPDMKTFKSLKKEEDPFMKFWLFVTEQLGTNIKGFDVSSVKLSKKDYEVLEKYAKAWFKKQSYYKLLSARKFDASFGMHCLNASPSEFYGLGTSQPETGFAYVVSNWEEIQLENRKNMEQRAS